MAWSSVWAGGNTGVHTMPGICCQAAQPHTIRIQHRAGHLLRGANYPRCAFDADTATEKTPLDGRAGYHGALASVKFYCAQEQEQLL